MPVASHGMGGFCTPQVSLRNSTLIAWNSWDVESARGILESPNLCAFSLPAPFTG